MTAEWNRAIFILSVKFYRSHKTYTPYCNQECHVLRLLTRKCVGKSFVTNLSQSGMQIRGEHAAEPGLDLALRLTRSG